MQAPEDGDTETKLDAFGYIQPVQLVVRQLREPILKFASVSNHPRCRIQNALQFVSQDSRCSSKQTVTIVNTAGDKSMYQGRR